MYTIFIEREGFGDYGSGWSHSGDHKTIREIELKRIYFEGKGERVQIYKTTISDEGNVNELIYDTMYSTRRTQ